MLVVLSGLPGVGKTTIARELAVVLNDLHVRIDSIEQALRHAGWTVDSEGRLSRQRQLNPLAVVANASARIRIWAMGRAPGRRAPPPELSPRAGSREAESDRSYTD
jgi:2-C-methyl-D-erythritol 4-phosphate cytidylyltransferase